MESREALRAELSYRRDVIADAALRCFARSSVEAVTIGEIIKECRASRSSVYREFSSGKAGILRYHHIQTMLIVEGAIARRVLSPGIEDYRTMVQAGARGLFDGLSWAPWAQYLVDHPALATAYVLNPDDGGLIRFVADYTAACATGFGADDAQGAARRLVRDLLSNACRDLVDSDPPSWPAEFPAWPRWIDTPVEEFLRETGLQGRRFEPHRKHVGEPVAGTIAGLLAATSAARL